MSFFMGVDNTQCAAMCQAYGADIKTIAITNIEGGIEPLKTRTENNGKLNTVYALFGPTRDEVDGVYACSVENDNGDVYVWNVTLRSWGFPDVTNSTLEYEGDIAIFTCSANAGGRRMDLMVEANLGPGDNKVRRIDTDPNFHTEKSQTGPDKQIRVKIPKSDVIFPLSMITCRAKTDAGESKQSNYINFNSGSEGADYYLNSGMFINETFLNDY